MKQSMKECMGKYLKKLLMEPLQRGFCTGIPWRFFEETSARILERSAENNPCMNFWWNLCGFFSGGIIVNSEGNFWNNPCLIFLEILMKKCLTESVEDLLKVILWGFFTGIHRQITYEIYGSLSNYSESNFQLNP